MLQVLLGKKQRIVMEEQKKIEDQTFYYFGEFGIFNIEILGGIYHYFKENPKAKLKIITFEDYAKILKILYPDRVSVEVYDQKFENKNGNRSVHESYIDKSYDIHGFKNLSIISKDNSINKYSIDEIKCNTNDDPKKFSRIFHISDPILYEMSDNPIKNNIVCICPRFREHHINKNIFSEEWDIILKNIIQNNPEAKIVILGKKEELLALEHKSLIFLDNIYEHIYYLNKCDYGVFPDSGMAEFALNCNCRIVKVLFKGRQYSAYNRQGFPKPLLHGFNPFGATIEKKKRAEDIP